MEDYKSSNKFILMVKGILVSIGITLIMIFALSVILSTSDVKESVVMPTVIFITAFSILIGGFIITKKLDEKGIIYGSILGVSYMVFLYLISSIMNFDFSLNINSFVMIAIGVIGGAVGGILGVNLK